MTARPIRSSDVGAPANAESIILSLAARQHGAVSRAQLLRAGLSAALLDHRLRARRLRALHRGVYLVGPLTVAHTRLMAAVLACGEGAILSHRSAGVLWMMTPGPAEDGPVDITVVRGRAGPRPGIRVRRARTVHRDEITVRDGIPVTAPGRTLLDLASEASSRELERALAEAFAGRLVEHAALLALLDRHARRPGARRLRRLLEDTSPVPLTRSEAEERLLALVRRARLRTPEVNVRVAGHEVDFLWRAERLVVEVDGHAFHSSDARFQSDRRRDATLIAAGLRVMRVTWRQITDEHEAVLARLAQALGRARVP